MSDYLSLFKVHKEFSLFNFLFVLLIYCTIDSEPFSELLHISWRKIECHFNFVTFLLPQTYFLSQSLPFSLSPTVMLDFEMQIQWYVWSIRFGALTKGTFIRFFNHIRSSSDFFSWFLNPKLTPLLFSILKYKQLSCNFFIRDWIVLNFRDHDFIEKINFPKFLIITCLFVIFRVSYGVNK